jgi:hypothetical protein
MTPVTLHLSPTQLHRTVASMERHGGGFCRALAGAWYLADTGNKARIESTFAHILADYAPGSGFYEDEY